MGRVNEIPEDFYIEFDLDARQEKCLIDQMNRFLDLKDMDIELSSIEFDNKNKVMLSKGTLVHGLRFGVNEVSSIANSGILTGQALGIPEDGETFYCADFHKVPDDMSIDEYNEQFFYRDGRCPFGNGLRGSHSIAFIIEPREEAEELLSYDCYKNNTAESEITKTFVNVRGLPSNEEKASSILYGVPKSLFKGIVIGNALLNRKEVLQLLIRLFPNCYISSIYGGIIYNPSLDNGYGEVVQLRAEKENYEFDLARLKSELESAQKQVKAANESKYQLQEAMIKYCPSDEVAKIFVEQKLYQGNYEATLAHIEKVKANSEVVRRK